MLGSVTVISYKHYKPFVVSDVLWLNVLGTL